MTSPGTFTYDDKGNTIQDGVTGATYTWDYLNRMEHWAKTGATTQDYVYNADGMRVSKTPSGGTATNFLLDGREIAEEITGENVTSYIGPGLIGKIASATRTIYHADGLGSTRALSDDDTPVAITEAGIYDAYGNVAAIYGNAPSFGYAGQHRYYADSTGLDYLKARYYDPAVGRFVSRDPIGYRGGLDVYIYAKANPVNRVDPKGLDCIPNYWLLPGGPGLHGGPGFPYDSGGCGIPNYSVDPGELVNQVTDDFLDDFFDFIECVVTKGDRGSQGVGEIACDTAKCYKSCQYLAIDSKMYYGCIAACMSMTLEPTIRECLARHMFGQ